MNEKEEQKKLLEKFTFEIILNNLTVDEYCEIVKQYSKENMDIYGTLYLYDEEKGVKGEKVLTSQGNLEETYDEIYDALDEFYKELYKDEKQII